MSVLRLRKAKYYKVTEMNMASYGVSSSQMMTEHRIENGLSIPRSEFPKPTERLTLQGQWH